MLSRNKTNKDIRSKIRHENAQLGGGTQMGGVPNNYGLHINALDMRQQQQQQQQASQAPQQLHRSPDGFFHHQSQPVPSASTGPPVSAFQHTQSPARQYSPLPPPERGLATTDTYMSSGSRTGHDAPLTHPAVASVQAQEVGAGPSSLSLAPSDSVSNYEGRPSTASRGSSSNEMSRPEPSHESTASFARGLGQSLEYDPVGSRQATPTLQAIPSRPARSGRRPHGRGAGNAGEETPSRTQSPMDAQASDTVVEPVGRNLLGSARTKGTRAGSQDANTFDDTSRNQAPIRSADSLNSEDRHARSMRVRNHENHMSDPQSFMEEEDGAAAERRKERSSRTSKRNAEPLHSPPLGSLTRPDQPAALSSVLSALSQAGRRQGQTRILRGVTAEEESRRRRVERKMEAAQSRESKPVQSYINPHDEEAFQEICAVLRKAKAEWDFVVGDDFNPVSLALSLMDESSLGANVREFDEIKSLIEHSLQGTVDDHYESFATAIGLHSNVLHSLTNAQGGVTGARRRLRDARDALGAKRADLVQLWNRSQVVKDSLQLLDTIDHLKGIPDRLESLMAEKQFLEAVKLLNRALKVCAKSDVLEIGAAADLRGYLRGQEQAMFDILIEELHNHLYLKSYFCDARWKAYTAGQSTLPEIDFGQDYDELAAELRRQHGQSNKMEASAKLNGDSHGREELVQPYTIEDSSLMLDAPHSSRARKATSSKLVKFLQSLDDRPAIDPSEENVLDLAPENADRANVETAGLPSSTSIDSMAGQPAPAGASYQQHNPETDSFLYIEMLLEALARLGKLKATQEVISQRLPTELHQLVDATIDEVETRSDVTRRSSTAILRPESYLLSNSSAMARSFAEGSRESFRGSLYGYPGSRMSIIGSASVFGAMRASALETNQVRRDAETMRDVFWTLFSKLDAVLQGHRVVFEVMTRICSRSTASVYKTVKLGKPTSLTEVWRPIQLEVRNLLHEHLVDDSDSSSARRNAVISVNEVLRQGSFLRDRSRPLFHLITDSAARPGANLSRRDFAPLRRHEESLSSALRDSVPGLVGAAGESGQNAAFQHPQSNATSFAASRSAITARKQNDTGNHKLLVKPDAFNISILFQPALAFIERVKDLLPPEAAGRLADIEDEGRDGFGNKSAGFSQFLDEFVRDTFLGQLEDKVQHLFATAVGGPDAFQEDAMLKARSQEKPIVRSVTNILVLIDSLYSMLRTTPFHRESYSLLIIQTIVQYHQRCHERFGELTVDDFSRAVETDARASTPAQQAPRIMQPILSATLAQRPEIFACLSESVSEDVRPERYDELLELENALELKLCSEPRPSSAITQLPTSPKTPSTPADGVSTIGPGDLMRSRKKLVSLGILHNSILWLYDRIIKLKATTEEMSVAPVAKARLSLNADRRFELQEGEHGNNDGDEPAQDEGEFKLPLSASMAKRFEALPGTYRHLCNVILFTLRLEVRARAMRHLDLAINEGNYLVEDAVLEPDPHIVDLNSELASLDDIFSDTLRPQYHAFIFAGLASLMDLHLCRAIRKVRFINRNGLTKMIRNILALQQNMRNIVVVNESMRSIASGKGTAPASSTPEEKEAHKDMIKKAQLTAMYIDRGSSFERSRKLWELVGREADELLAIVRATGAKHSFEEYQAALNLILGLDNASGQQTSMGATMNKTQSSDQSLLPPGAHLLPGTTQRPRDHSRQKINEYLIELHEIAGEAV